MKLALGFSLAVLTLTGCPDGGDTGKTDTGDTTTTPTGPVVQSIFYDGDSVEVTWSSDIEGESGMLVLKLAETGDTSGGCQTNPNCSDEGFWTEEHNDYEVVSADTAAGTEVKAITLTVVNTYDDYVQNSTTIMDISNPTLESQLSYQVDAYDSAGNYFDCLAGGHEPSYWTCPNTI